MTAGTLAAIAAAEAEAREVVRRSTDPATRELLRDALTRSSPYGALHIRWASDRLRLCARDRAVLGRHEIVSGEYGDFFCLRCDTYSCAEAEPVIAYWLGATT